MRQVFQRMQLAALHLRRIENSLPVLVGPPGGADANLGRAFHKRPAKWRERLAWRVAQTSLRKSRNGACPTPPGMTIKPARDSHYRRLRWTGVSIFPGRAKLVAIGLSKP